MDTAPRHGEDRASRVAADPRGRGPLTTALWAGVLAALAAGCAAGRLADGAYVNPATAFRVPLPPAPWAPISLPEVDVAFRHPERPGTIAVFSACEGLERGPLRILARRLFFGLKEREMVAQTPVSVDGAEAMRTVVRGVLEGRPVVVESVVVRRGDCVYDMVLTAPPDSYPSLRADFEGMAAGWERLP